MILKGIFQPTYLTTALLIKELIIMPIDKQKSIEKGLENESLPHHADAIGIPGKANKNKMRINKKVSLIPTRAVDTPKTIIKNMLRSNPELPSRFLFWSFLLLFRL